MTEPSGTPVDRFVAFVDLLAVDLDAAPARAEQMAAAAHLSRFHFERVIAAVAGETPTRFRARVLMERAAHRMTTTEETLLDIAVAAGSTTGPSTYPSRRRSTASTASTARACDGRCRD